MQACTGEFALGECMDQWNRGLDITFPLRYYGNKVPAQFRFKIVFGSFSDCHPHRCIIALFSRQAGYGDCIRQMHVPNVMSVNYVMRVNAS